jgi:hypothetical protein
VESVLEEHGLDKKEIEHYGKKWIDREFFETLRTRIPVPIPGTFFIIFKRSF